MIPMENTSFQTNVRRSFQLAKQDIYNLKKELNRINKTLNKITNAQSKIVDVIRDIKRKKQLRQ